MSYFHKNYAFFDIKAKGIRNCQRGAYYAVLAHFTRSENPCLLGLPTGSGKTALMMALCFGLKINRALIITPYTILREQTSSKFRMLKDLKKAKAIPRTLKGPKVRNNKHKFQDKQDWNECLQYDVVVATTKTTSPKEKQVIENPVGIFDILFIDEAHHSPASTWTALLESFQIKRTKIILLTGTPYRRDKKDIKADLVYDYSIDLAIQNKIFAPVKFINAGRSVKSRDTKLAKKGLRVWKDTIAESKQKPLLLIKTDRIKHANLLSKKYNKLGAKVLLIHTGLSHANNLETLDLLKKGEIDGIVTVGMVGEGLDIPKLKIAIFHRNPQSLPHTIQVIGRLARTNTSITQGKVVGFTDDFSRETFKLYEASPDWLKLIPDLEKKLISGRVNIEEDQLLEPGQDFIFDSDINPFFSISAYKFINSPKMPNISAISNWKNKRENSISSVERISTYKNDTLLIITKLIDQPGWLKPGGFSRILQESFDLHIYFQHKNIVLEYTKAPDIATRLRKILFGDTLKKLSPKSLNRVLKSGEGAYVVVGLKNSGGFSQLNPNYKMLLGSEAQATITNSDTKNFHTGHCLMRMRRHERTSEVRGIAYKRSKIWALRRENLVGFREWCFLIANSLLGKGDYLLPGLERLRQTELLKSFKGKKPLAIVENSALLTKKVRFISNNSERDNLIGILNIIIKSYNSKIIKCAIEGFRNEFNISIGKDGEILYSSKHKLKCLVEVDPIDGVLKKMMLLKFLELFPPKIIFADGSTLTDGLYSKPSYIPELDSKVFKKIDWDSCDINSEIEDTPHGISVQKYILKKYLCKYDVNTIIIQDHGTWELADIITIDLIKNQITFFHVKSTGVKKGKRLTPGARREDIDEVLSQSICSGRWVKNIGFAEEIERRLKNRSATKIISGKETQILKFLKTYESRLWAFEIIAVQPGVKISEFSDSMKSMLASTQDYITSTGATFQFIGS